MAFPASFASDQNAGAIGLVARSHCHLDLACTLPHNWLPGFQCPVRNCPTPPSEHIPLRPVLCIRLFDSHRAESRLGHPLKVTQPVGR